MKTNLLFGQSQYLKVPNVPLSRGDYCITQMLDYYLESQANHNKRVLHEEKE